MVSGIGFYVKTNKGSELHVPIGVRPKEDQLEWMRRSLRFGLLMKCTVTVPFKF